MAEKLHVGDKVIYCFYGKRPIETSVIKVTPTGRIKVASNDPWVSRLAFQLSELDSFYLPANKIAVLHRIYPWSKETWKSLMDQAEQREQQDAEYMAERAQRRGE